MGRQLCSRNAAFRFASFIFCARNRNGGKWELGAVEAAPSPQFANIARSQVMEAREGGNERRATRLVVSQIADPHTKPLYNSDSSYRLSLSLHCNPSLFSPSLLSFFLSTGFDDDNDDIRPRERKGEKEEGWDH